MQFSNDEWSLVLNSSLFCSSLLVFCDLRIDELIQVFSSGVVKVGNVDETQNCRLCSAYWEKLVNK